ncbi:threonylcarbamoyl-AMP synthase [Enterococcus florum]|uniref:Threonylcarbamoyl-AMP synthase n=1 Tax=Enterococcus florum TaxID=2480627 RepID=A0A4P5PEN0_9ENTE|nr:L-threonylcarbamoyladenylate synthase [Enterococcus florum]GCF95114.1 threonylcarbamoyl-AMP synthase [Enterococcus florum]
METKLFQAEELDQAAQILKHKGLVAFPTETVYGLGADALYPDSVKQVFEVKGRPSDNPLIVHVADFEMTRPYVEKYHPLTDRVVKTFWPGPLTLIFPIKKNTLASIVTGGLSTAAFRMPDNKKTLELIRKVGDPLVGPSANTSGKPSPTTAAHVFHDLNGKIAGILDDGATKIGVESTVLDMSGEVPTILRPGAITKEMLEAALGVEVLLDQHLVIESETPKAPGMKYKHYSPDTPVLMIQENQWQPAMDWAKTENKRVGILAGPAIAEKYRSQDRYIFDDDTVEAAARGLYSGLRALDEAGQIDLIFAQIIEEDSLGAAYMNRLKKAASQKYFSEK